MATVETIDRVFAMFHSSYGDIALTRLASGVPDGEGKDTGIIQARRWWHQQLRTYTDEVVVEAASDSTKVYTAFPATLPQLRALCEEETRRRAYRAHPRLGHGVRGPTPADRERLQRLRNAAAEREARRQLELVARGLV